MGTHGTICSEFTLILKNLVLKQEIDKVIYKTF